MSGEELDCCGSYAFGAACDEDDFAFEAWVNRVSCHYCILGHWMVRLYSAGDNTGVKDAKSFPGVRRPRGGIAGVLMTSCGGCRFQAILRGWNRLSSILRAPSLAKMFRGHVGVGLVPVFTDTRIIRFTRSLDILEEGWVGCTDRLAGRMSSLNIAARGKLAPVRPDTSLSRALGL